MSYHVTRPDQRRWADVETVPGLHECVLVSDTDLAPYGRISMPKEHYHPFEEIYFLLNGRALGTLDGADVPVEAGDLIWLGVDSTHGFVNEHDEPVRWLEVQSPVPPDSDAFFFPEDWKGLPSW
jgi:mannose-6-phosphate isomerase-like protein (cupin superfamily)